MAEPVRDDQPAATCCEQVYFCPTSGETECPVHGGFDVCCDRPDLHRPVASAAQGWRNYEFDFPGYIEAVETRHRLYVKAREASRKLDEANEIVREFEDKMKQAMENALAESRDYAMERADVQ